MRSENSSVRSKAAFNILVLLACASFASAAAEAQGSPFESASVAVAAGSRCTLHPEGNQDPRERLRVNADEDGVVRFMAVRPTSPTSVQKLALECTDASGEAKTYSVDLRAADTFRPHPFDPSHTTLRVRPALTGNPGRFSQQDLLKAGYGVRPDGTANPDAYQKWLAAASIPSHLLRTDKAATPVVLTHPLDLDRLNHRPPLQSRIVQKVPSAASWTGPILSGAFQKKATAAQTISYGSIFTFLYVPNLLTSSTAESSTIWVGLDDVFQAILEADSTSTTASFSIHRQDFSPHGNQSDEAGTLFTPQPGDLLSIGLWYCDSSGNIDMNGGYACSSMIDVTQNVAWQCTLPDDPDCPSYHLDRADLGNGKLGFEAEFIIENDTGQVTNGSQEWPVFSPVIMNGWAGLVKGNSQNAGTVGTTTDPHVQLLTDASTSARHMHIALSPFSTRWDEIACHTNEKWDGNTGECVPSN